jgi:RNA polymerase sigma-70 factor (ECF subfamily)
MKNCTEQTDAELVALTIDDKEYFSCVIERYEKPLARYVRRITRAREEDVEDLLQEAFIKAYVNLHSFDTDLSFSSWIYRIVHNVVISEHRKKQSRPEGHIVEMEESVFTAIASDIDIERELEIEFLRQHLQEALAAIPEKYRIVLVLRFMEEKEYKEISDIMEKPMGTIATLLNRAKARLKKEFIRLGYAEGYE